MKFTNVYSRIVIANQVTRKLLELQDYYRGRGIPLEEVNQGDCLYVTGEVCRTVKDAEEVWDHELDPEEHRGHAVIRYQNRYYDIESPQGVQDWKQLPVYSRPDGGWRWRD